MLLLAACSNGAGGMSGMDHSGSGMSSAAPAASSSTHNAQDVSFAQGMAMHHQQAIEMADMVLDKQGVNSKVTTLATQIKNEQKPEIEQMNGWLKSWGEQTMSGSTSGMDHDMGSMGGGMMSEDDMNALKKASGDTASSLFLTQMTTHHKGAIEMAQTEVSKGKNPDAVALAKKIISDQTTQITQMQDLLKQL
jgi:uncharacterized protein (DUF305 family)